MPIDFDFGLEDFQVKEKKCREGFVLVNCGRLAFDRKVWE